MPKLQKSTWLTKEAAEAQRQWYVVDVDNQILGRAATKIAMVLRGKHKPTFTPNTDCGDFVVVVNASKVRLSGPKGETKLYRWHTEFPGGLKAMPAAGFIAAHPERAIQRAVRGMLPKGPLGRRLIKKLKVYAGPEHQHVAQQPQALGL
jgi:large subunit ribosomal protein L13